MNTKRVIKVKIDEWDSSTGRLQREAWVGESRFYLKEQEGSAFEALKQEDIQADLLGSDEVSGIPLPVSPKMTCSLLPEDFCDFWEQRGRFWTRHHVRPRSGLFLPKENSAGGPDVSMLSSIRASRFNPATGAPPGIENQSVRFDNLEKGGPVRVSS